MILVAVIIGYILGILPFVIPEIYKRNSKIQEKKNDIKQYKTQEKILDEWLNGPSNTKINQEDILKEYLTGENTEKGE